jgi:hypothetical protein
MANATYGTIKSDVTSGNASPQTLQALPGLRNTDRVEAWASTGLLVGGVLAVGAGAALYLLHGSSPAPAATASGSLTPSSPLAWTF